MASPAELVTAVEAAWPTWRNYLSALASCRWEGSWAQTDGMEVDAASAKLAELLETLLSLSVRTGVDRPEAQESSPATAACEQLWRLLSRYERMPMHTAQN
jgi:hypothetical protein